MEANCRLFPGEIEWDTPGALLYKAQGEDDAVDRRDGESPFFFPRPGDRTTALERGSRRLTRMTHRTNGSKPHSWTTRTKSGASSPTRSAPASHRPRVERGRTSCWARTYSNQCPHREFRLLGQGTPPFSHHSSSDGPSGRSSSQRPARSSSAFGPMDRSPARRHSGDTTSFGNTDQDTFDIIKSLDFVPLLSPG